MLIRSTAATQAAHSWRVHCPGSVTSGCSAASQRPIIPTLLRTDRRVVGASVEVAYQRSAHPAHGADVPCSAGTRTWAAVSGGWQCPSDATACWMPDSGRRCDLSIAGCCRSRANAPVVRSSSSGLRLSRNTWPSTAPSRLSPPSIRYPHPARMFLT